MKTITKPGAKPGADPKAAAGVDRLAGQLPAATAGETASAAIPGDNAPGDLSPAAVDGTIDAGIGDALAGRRPLPTPAAEAAAAIAEALIDPRPGSGPLDDRAPAGGAPVFAGLTAAEIAAMNAQLALLPPEDFEAFRARLAQAPIDPTKGQGTLDDRGIGLRDRLLGVDRLGTREAFAERIGDAVRGPNERDLGGPALRVVSTREGFRRGGRAWSTTPTIVRLVDLTDDQVAAIEAEPTLVVERV